jgi:FtsH-binding integral membrane protein
LRYLACVITDRRRETIFVVLFALAGAIAARLVARYALGDVPHVMDEMAYDLQSRTFADGALTLPVREPRGAFALWYVDDRWATFSVFPPGWPMVLAAFAKLGLRAWANPLLYGATTLVVASIADRIAGARARVLAAGVWASCPQALVLASSLMSHTLVACAAGVALLGAVAWLHGPRRPWLDVAAGAALGVAALARPLCAIVIAIAILALLVLARRRTRTPGLASFARFAAPLAVALVLLGAYNRALTGSALRFPQSAYFDEHAPPVDEPFFAYGPGCNDLGFGRGCDHGIRDARHDLRNALSNTGDNLSCWILLGAGGPLLFVAAGASVGRGKHRADAAAILAATPAAIALYALYWYSGSSFGARFYHAALPGIVVAAAIGLAPLERRALALVVALGLAYDAYAMARASRELADGYWGTDDRFARVAATWSGPRALVLVAFRHERAIPLRYEWTSKLRGEWTPSRRVLGALHPNDTRLSGPVVFARFHPGLVKPLRARFPDRELWLYVVEDDRARDSLARYDETPDAPEPKENFGAYVLEP